MHFGFVFNTLTAMTIILFLPESCVATTSYLPDQENIIADRISC